MAALQCEICGGKLMAKSGGLFECEYCGMQYDKTRIQEMVQEIKGTVKVEGTVEVKGTVRVEGTATKEDLVQRGEEALKIEQWDRAKDLFDQALKLSPSYTPAYLGLEMAAFRCSKVETLARYHAQKKKRHFENVTSEVARVFWEGEQRSKFDKIKELAVAAGDSWLTVYETAFCAETARLAAKAEEEKRQREAELEQSERVAYAKEHMEDMIALACKDNKTDLSVALAFFEEYREYEENAKIALVCRKKTELLRQIPEDGLVERFKQVEELYRACVEEKDAAEQKLSGLFLTFGNREEKKRLKQTVATLTQKAEALKVERSALDKAYEARISVTREVNDQLEMVKLVLTLRKAKKGDAVSFGRYPFDMNEEREIEWIVHNNPCGYADLISKYVLDYVPYGACSRKIAWEETNLYSWLNEVFPKQAFSRAAEPYMRGGHPTLLTTLDLVWSNRGENIALATPYVRKKGVLSNSNRTSSSWYLRDECLPNGTPAYVDYDGTVHHRNSMKSKENDHAQDGVRPVVRIWLDQICCGEN